MNHHPHRLPQAKIAAQPKRAAKAPATAVIRIPKLPASLMVLVATIVVDKGADSVGAETVVVMTDGVPAAVGKAPIPIAVAVTVMSRRWTFTGAFFLGTILVKVAFCSKDVCLRMLVTLRVVTFVRAGAISDVLLRTCVKVLTVATLSVGIFGPMTLLLITLLTELKNPCLLAVTVVAGCVIVITAVVGAAPGRVVVMTCGPG